MATEITSLSELNSTDVQEQQDILATFLAETYPQIDLSHGVMRDLVQYLNAIFSAKEREELERWKGARSLLAIQENPDLENEDSVDNILSNYNITRKEGTYALGTVLLEFDLDTSIIVPMNTEFTFNNLTFRTTISYMIVSSDSSSSELADRQLIRLDNGNYGCTVDVTASQVGSASCLKRGTQLQCTGITHLAKATSYDNFYGGTDTETNEELLTRLKSGLATKCWGSRINIENLLRSDDTLNSLVALSVIGTNDAEMIRDQITLFPISTGGKVDIYVKTAPVIYTATDSVTATLTDKDINNDYWVAVVPNSILPGFWRVSDIVYNTELPEMSVVNLISQEIVSTREDLRPEDAGYSIYKDTNIRFSTPVSDFKTGTTQEFNVTVMGLPHIEYTQKLCQDRSIVPVASDVLVKSAVPCIITATITIKQSKNNVVTEDTVNTIKDTATRIINNKQFDGYLATTELTDILQQYLTTSQVISSVQLNGIILGPNGTMYRDVSNKVINIPEMPLNCITANTTTFFSDVSYIDVVLETIDA